MNSRKLFSLFTVIIYSLFVLGGLFLSVLLYFSIAATKSSGDGVANGLAMLFGLVFIIIFAAYALFALIPLILKIIHLARGANGRVLPAVCLGFDAAFILIHTILLSELLKEGADSPYSIPFFLALILLSVAALIFNILNVACKASPDLRHGKTFPSHQRQDPPPFLPARQPSPRVRRNPAVYAPTQPQQPTNPRLWHDTTSSYPHDQQNPSDHN